MVLLALWGEVSDQLCADLMVWDSLAHPDPTRFDKWVKTGICPYSGLNVQRVANFREKKELWGHGKTDNQYSLMIRLLQEKCVKE